MSTEIINADQLKICCSRILQHQDIPAFDADFIADSLVEADLRGTHSHGCNRLGRYIRELSSQITNPHPQITTLDEGPAFARVDGDGGMGPLVGRYAMELCISKAKTAGSATVTACRSRHFGAAGYYGLMAVKHNLIGIAMTVASPRIAPTGGTQALFGNNPLSLAVPGQQDFPLIVDFAAGNIAAGKLELAAAAETPIADGLALDANGRPTNDPKVALNGSIIPIGAHKGYGLTLFIEILAGLLGGSPYFGVKRDQVANHVRDLGIGHFFMAIDPSRFMPLEHFKEAINAMVTTTKASPQMPHTDELYLPGELEHRRRQEYLATGIPLAKTTVDMVRQLGESCNASL